MPGGSRQAGRSGGESRFADYGVESFSFEQTTPVPAAPVPVPAQPVPLTPYSNSERSSYYSSETDFNRDARESYQTYAAAHGIEDLLRNVLNLQDESGESTIKFNEMLGALSPRERVLFLQLLHNFSGIEPEYVENLVNSFYDAMRSPNIGDVYSSMLGYMEGMWTDAYKENFQSIVDNPPPRVGEYSLREKMLLALGFHYAFIEAFAIKPEDPPGFWRSVLRAGVTGFARGTTSAEASAITTEEAVAIGALSGQMGETTASDLARTIIYAPLMSGVTMASAGMLTTAATYFLTWLDQNFPEDQRRQTIKLIVDVTKAGLANDPYSLMELASGIGIIGDKWVDENNRQQIADGLEVIHEAVDDNVIIPHEQPWQLAQMYRLLAIAVGVALQEPTFWYKDGVIDNVLEDGFEEGHLTNENDMREFVDAMAVIATERGRYDLADVAEAIFDACEEVSFGEVLRRAKDLASRLRVIDEDTLRNPSEAERVEDVY